MPVPQFLVEDLARHVEGKSVDDLVLTGQRGAVMRTGTIRRGALIEAAKAIGIPGFTRTSYGTQLRAWPSRRALM